ncbi:hypothetical protein [Nocardia mangyaensis]|uniref:hypothetical protein n=1 Tax=Nocardia mangyaensis TaxID=2213200 RepID=UPI002674E38C|nr:hypothetical protein [Nocardia mangyaensis]MDO3645766.1 hypothetical protein [Nocardia mangyaensis]
MSTIHNVLIAPGTTVSDRVLCYGTAVAGGVLAWALAVDEGWPWWTLAIVTVIAFDLFGGAVVNATSAATRKFHGPNRTARHHLAFVAFHVQPFLMALVVPGFTWATALGIYVLALAGAVLVLRVGRPAGFAIAVLGLTLLPAPEAVLWFTPVLLIKLLLSYLEPTTR